MKGVQKGGRCLAATFPIREDGRTKSIRRRKLNERERSRQQLGKTKKEHNILMEIDGHVGVRGTLRPFLREVFFVIKRREDTLLHPVLAFAEA